MVFASKHFYEMTKSYIKEINDVAESLGYDIHVVPEIDERNEDDEIESELLASFDSITFI